MQLYTIDPLLDSRWEDLVSTHRWASVFHQPGWLKALAKTYGYRPLILTRTPPLERLTDGVPFCDIRSSITGCRLVSLPFADHAEPLLREMDDASDFTAWMRTECVRQKWKYVELRPLSWKLPLDSGMATSEVFWFHSLDLTPPVEQLFRGLHKSCLQRRIRRAEREQLFYEKGCSKNIIDDFYRLLLITRRRHQLLPQPRAWFRNLIEYMSPDVEIRMARKEGNPIAAILSLRHRSTVVYKYGCSDERFHHLAGMPFLFWKLIEESRTAGAEQLDLGRTSLDNRGLIEFKDRLGAERRQISYLRYPQAMVGTGAVGSYLPATRRLFSILPDALSSRAGQLLYRHIG